MFRIGVLENRGNLWRMTDTQVTDPPTVTAVYLGMKLLMKMPALVR